MMTLVRTELYKLRTFRTFHKHLLIFTILNLGISTLVFAFYDQLMSMADQKPTKELTVTLADALVAPFGISLLMIFMFIAAIGFLYMDFANGYVKNIAGQVKSKDAYVIAKLIAVSLSNLVFFIAGALTTVLSALVTGKFSLGEDIGAGAVTLLLKWLLSVALCAILLFLSVGIKNHTLSVIAGVVFSLGAFGLIYSGVNYGIKELFHTNKFDVSEYSPSMLLESVNAVKGDYVINAVVVSAVFIAAFTLLTCKVFKKRDIH